MRFFVPFLSSILHGTHFSVSSTRWSVDGWRRRGRGNGKTAPGGKGKPGLQLSVQDENIENLISNGNFLFVFSSCFIVYGLKLS